MDEILSPCKIINITLIPLNIGQIFQTPSPPIPNHWPRDASRKNAGIPARNKQNKYGTRNAPEKKTYQNDKRLVIIFDDRLNISLMQNK